jgi:hypothetical protein
LNGAVDVGSLVRPDENGMFNDGGEVVVVGKLNDNRQGLQFDSVVTGTSGRGNAEFKQKGSAVSECYPDPSTSFAAKNGRDVPKAKYLVVCKGASAQTTRAPRTTQPTVRPTTTSSFTNALSRLNSRFGSRFGDLSALFSGGRGGRGKRQTEGSGDIDRPVGPSNTIGGFIERTWAYLTIKKLTREAEEWIRPEAERNGKRQRALELSLKYGFVSKYTSMIVVHNQLNGNGNDISEDTPEHNNNGLPPADDMPVGGVRGERQQSIVNKVSPDGKCRGAVLLTVDARASADIKRQQRQLEQLVDMIFAEKSFTTPQIAVMRLDTASTLTISPEWSSNAAEVKSKLRALINGQSCTGCLSGGRALTGFVQLVTNRKNERLHKSVVLFTDSSSPVTIVKNLMGQLAMPKVVVSASAPFVDSKRSELLKMTSDNQILDQANLADIISLITC